jgi:hypothetical protein
MKLEVVLLLIVCLPVFLNGIITIQANFLKYKMEMKSMEDEEEDEEEENRKDEGPVGFQ